MKIGKRVRLVVHENSLQGAVAALIRRFVRSGKDDEEMKVTWFPDMVFRLHVAGRIVVVNPARAPKGVDQGELTSGAETIIPASDPDLDHFDPALWAPRRRRRLIDETEGEEGLRLHRFGGDGLVCDSLDEGLLVLADQLAEWGRWADGSNIVLGGTGAHCAALGSALLDIARPRFIALAVTDDAVDLAFEGLAGRLAGASLTVLEPGMAVEA